MREIADTLQNIKPEFDNYMIDNNSNNNNDDLD